MSNDDTNWRDRFSTGRKQTNYPYDKLQPITDSAQYAEAGSDNIEKKYAGHVCYSPDLDSDVYQSIRKKENRLKSVNGIAISKHILDEIIQAYDVEYIFIGYQRSKDIHIYDVDTFKHDWKSDKYDEQVYAKINNTYDTVENELDFIFSNHPADNDKSIDYQSGNIRD
jgi:hypothetical protein